jgi:phenylpropionate dioxygenase-like ring-hydroxylating dioxygenase large terminal subunit
MLQNHWYLICPETELKKQIINRKILNQEIILFRDEQGGIAALENRCCHRNVRLSLGYLEQGHVVCGYHGWKYDSAGTCIHIPSQTAEAKIPQTAKIRSYPTLVFNRWIWVFMGDAEKAAGIKPYDLPEMKEWNFTYQSYTFESDLELAAESLVDPYHLNYAHRRSIKSLLGRIEEFPAQFNLQVLEDGLSGTYLRANRGSFFEKMYFGHEPLLTAHIRFYYPTLSRLEVRFKKRILLILEQIIEVDDRHVNMIQITLWKNIFSLFPAFARFFMKRKSDQIVREDLALLSSQAELSRQHGGKLPEVSVKGDEVSIAFRKFWRKMINGQ